jgi:hypothetical protein
VGWKVEASSVPGDADFLDRWRNLEVTRLYPLLYPSSLQRLHSPQILAPLAVPASDNWVARSCEPCCLQLLRDFV